MNYKKTESVDGTIKLTYKDGYSAVIIPSKNEKRTLCLSCQIGCPIECTFCRAGTFKKNLTAEDIIQQYTDAKEILSKNPDSIVFMGMGEPLLNYEAVRDSINQLNKAGIRYRRMTLSTAGVNLEKIHKVPFNIAISLHSMNPKTRKQKLGIKTDINDICEFIHKYADQHRYGIMLEISLIEGINDTDEEIHLITGYNWPENINFNLIEFNDYNVFKKSSRLEEVKERIRKAGYKCFIRPSRGNDIEAACGMLDSIKY
jgi:23S rRNA (adenine2503-C2)-methyltransferase